MMLYFLLEGLDVLGLVDELPEKTRKDLTDYIYALQLEDGGFTSSRLYRDNGYGVPHIVFTYSAINCLKILNDDLSRLNRTQLLGSVKKCQQPDGSFSSFCNTDESDLRFVYAAVAICSLLNGLDSIDADLTANYIRSCYNFDGGFGLRPGC
jgi:prenyltransferase beta subunit